MVEGSSTVEPISLKAKESFNTKYPKVNISVSGQGTGNGFKALAKKECDFSDASRPIKQSELEACNAAGQAFVEVPVAYDGLTVVVNKENTFVDKLDIAQLTKIFRSDMAAKTWNEVNPDWPNEAITIYAPGVASGTHDYFMEVVGKDSEAGMRADDHTTLSEDDKLLVTGVKGEKFSIGFFGYSYFEANKDELKAVPIVNSAGEPISPSLKTIESGQYAPFSRPLFIYVSTASYDRAEVREFVDYYLENVVELVKQARYVPLPADVYKRARAHLDKGLTGTHYLDADGKKREGGISAIYVESNLTSK
jgi:phosphate transport system substrate-binding protein